jgi:peroxiredoxin
MPRGLEPGMKAPTFQLPRDGGGTTSLSDYAGRKLVLYFYRPAQSVDATQALNLSAGVSNCKVSRGRSLS